MMKYDITKVYSSLNILKNNNDIYTNKIMINHYSKQYDKKLQSISEGFLGDVGTAVKATYTATGMTVRGAKYGVQMAIQATKEIMKLVIKILKASWDMLKKAWISIGSKLATMKKQLQILLNLRPSIEMKLKNNLAEADIALDIVTTRTMTSAGWNLSKKSVNDSDNALSSPVRIFLELLSDKFDGEAPEDKIVDVKTGDDLYNKLDDLLVSAKRAYDSPVMKKYTSWDKKLQKINSKIVHNNIHKQYKQLSPDEFGRYVAQAFSPAGAFLDTSGKANFNRDRQRYSEWAKLITPAKESGLSGEQLVTEIVNSCDYIILLFKYILELDALTRLKEKAEKIERLNKTVDRLTKLSIDDINRIQKQKNNNVNNIKSMDKNGQPSEKDTSPNQKKQNIDGKFMKDEFNKSFNSQSNYIDPFDLEPFSEDALPELSAFGEDLFGDEPEKVSNNTSLQRIADDMHSTDKGQSYDRTKKMDPTENKAGTMKKNEFNMTEQDVDSMTIINDGLNYLKGYLTQAGNAYFDEASFFNVMCGVMTNTVGEFITTVQSGIKEKTNDKNVRTSEEG